MSFVDIFVALKDVCNNSDPEVAADVEFVLNSLILNKIELQEAITRLSEYLVNAKNAEVLKKYVSNLLLALVSAKIPLKPVLSSGDDVDIWDQRSHLDNCYVLSMLSDHPDILQYALKYFTVNPLPPFAINTAKNNYKFVPKKRRLNAIHNDLSDKQIVTLCHKLLNKLPNEFSVKWDWTGFMNRFSGNEDPEIRWMVKECMVIITNMTEAQSSKLSKKLRITEEEDLKYASRIKENIVRPVDEAIKDDNLESVTNIDGIMIPFYDKQNAQKSCLVPVKSTVSNLRSLALAVASGKACLLLGPVGSGKTSLVEHLAAITGRKGLAFKKVQLGDQTDSRMLLGSHQCTDVPGEFIWRPGVLTEAVQNGHWLLLEDIDCAALDVASTLSSLLERNCLCVPGYRDALPVTPGFQLFVTQRSIVTNFGFQKKMSSSSTLLQKHLTQINVEPLSRSELQQIIQDLYPQLTTISTRMIEVFMMFSVGSHDTSLQSTKEHSDDKEKNLILRGSRLISTRDLMKWCARSVKGFDVSSPESALKVLQDALDIFTCSVSSPEHRLELSKKIGTCLGVVETKTEFYCKHHKPNVSLHPTSLDVGRAKVPRLEKGLDSIELDNKHVVFSFTRQSACLLEKIACCVNSNEPVLLVGETGTGKTSSVQYLARQTGHKLVVINMNQQSDSADLLGGYKPVDMKYVVKPVVKEFEALFRSFYNVEKNKKFLGHIETCYETESWPALLKLMTQSHGAAVARLALQKDLSAHRVWIAFGRKLNKLEAQVKAASKLTFAFIEGSLVKAMQEGYWVLLDEINLASAEILECLSGLLEDKAESIELIEKGDNVPIKRHPNFTLFACMNPATDVGKKDLPVGLRNRFTEFFIDELTERNDLMLLIGDYLYHLNLSGAILEAIYSFYSSIRKEAKLNLVDGAGNAPHYSLRTLCRALTAAAKAKCGTVTRSLYESFCLSFLTQLDSSSHPKVEAMVAKAVLGKKTAKSVLNQMIPEPQVPGQNFLLFEGHWIPQGKLDIAIPEGYILTPTVRKNLRDIARIVSLGRLPVLLQGDTSVGKTSLITYIAKASGNYCVRINNHEHTDLQEYIGSYANDASGRLVFKEGVLVEAMRKGYWIILDELNLAPSDVLEALNRVLDDNRELFIPETQEVVKADPNFMLFATQNPPGLYGGRKMLSRAFRNRFVELHFDEIPRKELETILHQRCHVPPTYSKKMIAVMAELQTRRRGSAAVQGKDGFITLRDLFRWGLRYKQVSKDMLTEEQFYDWDQHIADEGYLVLAGRVRKTEERHIIEEVIEKQIKRKVNPENLFSLHQTTSPVTKNILEILLNNQLEEFSHVVWTYNMRRLGVLIGKAFVFNEPVLLVGETGCGKTTICQVLAALNKKQLLSVNCHMHTESSDFLGGLRPVRQYKNDGRLFEWVDGPLVKAMQQGDMFLADEISLADDSVLERMNSLLEPERQLVLSERGTEDNSDIIIIAAHQDFHFIGTMNPGGDFGKKELSPALRNRFTEIWCDSVTSRKDLLRVLEKSVNNGISLGNQEDGSSGIGSAILEFTQWLKQSEVTNNFPFSIRDLLSWVQFINVTISKGLLEAPEAYVHGACMAFLDCFGTALTGHVDSETLILLRTNAIKFLLNQIKTVGSEYTESLLEMLGGKQKEFKADSDETKFGIKPFYIGIGHNMSIVEEGEQFTFTAPTTGSNTLRLLRGLQLNKAILLEGNPGVGKTSLVTALARSSGHKVVRINLSDQTDITDLFGTDLPAEDGSFTFKEGAFLSALQNGDWILLDELNLAPQPVLEGLNACLDHRGEVYIPELGKTFKVKEQTRLFACQNPLKQGGARRGLPISFLNRFTQVYIDTLTKQDLIYIVNSQYPSLPEDILNRIVDFNCEIAHEVIELQSWGHRGGPWEMNLRDIQRWCEALIEDQRRCKGLSPGKFVDMLYINRMRTAEDKEKMAKKYDGIFLPKYPRSHKNPLFNITQEVINIGDVDLDRRPEKHFKNRRVMQTDSLLLRSQMLTLKALAQSVRMNWLSILVGPTATGKSTIVQILADLTANDLHVVPVTSAMDVSDLLGGFEQVDLNRNLDTIFDKIETLTNSIIRKIWLKHDKKKNNNLLTSLHEYNGLLSQNPNNNTKDEMDKFRTKLNFLLNHCKCLTENTKRSDTLKKIQELVAALNHLELKASKSSSVNAGGKFEWVDSLLVKTMIEGSWLLLDNVNLTSAAVLDRLNGLLEPQGVLNLPERGEMCEIKPHPNFRIFFTMDPKYGEISRAMRNRGVEIFLLRPEDFNVNLTDTMPYMDLSALLLSCELPMSYHKLFIKCHEMMASYIQGFERPTIFHLLQAAHLTRQQMIRAIPFDVALLTSFADVYIKPRSANDFVASSISSLAKLKNDMLHDIKNELQNIEVIEVITASSTLRVKQLCSHSALEIANQLAYGVIQVDEGFGNCQTTLMHTLYNVFVAYLRCPKEILGALRTAIDVNFTDRSDFEYKRKTYSQRLTEIAHIYFEKNPDHVANQRFFAEQYTLEEDVIKNLNTGSLLLYTQLVASYFMDGVSSDNGINFIDYARAVRYKNLRDEFADYDLLRNCLNYIETVEKTLEQVIKKLTPHLDDKTTLHVVHLLNWKNRFYDIAFSCMFLKNDDSRVRILNVDLVKSFYLHSRWLLKYLFEELFNLLPESGSIPRKFYERIESLTGENRQASSRLSKISKKLRGLYGQPKLYANQEQQDLCASRSSLYQSATIDLKQPLETQMHVFSSDFFSISHMNLALDVPDEEVIESIMDSLEKSKENPSQIDKSAILKVPMCAYVLNRIFGLIQNKLYEIISSLTAHDKEFKTNTDLSEVLSFFVHYGRTYKGLNPEMLSLLECVQKLASGDIDVVNSRISQLPVRFWDEFSKAQSNCLALRPAPFLNMSAVSLCPESEEADLTTKLPVHVPVMAYYVQKMTLVRETRGYQASMAYDKVSLRDQADYSSQLSAMQNTVWKNMGTLQVATTASLKSSALFEVQKFEELMFYMSCSIAAKKLERSSHTDEMIARLLIKLRFSFSENQDFIDLFDIAFRLKKSIRATDFDRTYAIEERIILRVTIAELNLLTSFISLFAIGIMKPVDYIEKYRLKQKYIEEDVKTFECLLGAFYIQGLVFGNITENKSVTFANLATETLLENKEKLCKLHPYCKTLFEMRQVTMEQIQKYASGQSHRPESPTYDEFYKFCNSLQQTTISSKMCIDLALSLLDSADLMKKSLRSSNRCGIDEQSSIRSSLNQTAVWLLSLDRNYQDIDEKYSEAFPDLAKPLKSSMSQIRNSVQTMQDLIVGINDSLEAGSSLPEIALKFIQYPHILPKIQQNKHLERFELQNINAVIKQTASEYNEAEYASTQLQVLKMDLFELKMYLTAAESMDEHAKAALLNILQFMVYKWKGQEDELAKKKQDDEALYVTKSVCDDEDDEVIAKKEITEMFPGFSEQDFADFRPPTLEQRPAPTPAATDNTNKLKILVTPEDISLVYKWHSQLIRNMAKAEWIPKPKKLVSNDVLTSFERRYLLSSRIIGRLWKGIDVELEPKMLPGMMVMLAQIRAKVDGNESSSGKGDFYRSPWISETRQCAPVLAKVKEATNVLLDQWPDFPTLKDIIVIIDRILDFPMTSPVSRFLTGLELLRDKIEEWNSNAHKGNNMIEQSLMVGQQIVNWRKLEMGHWKECLNNLWHRKQSEAHRSWFFLYPVIESYLVDDITPERMIGVLKDFIEASSLAHFEVGLDILYTFHGHLLYMEEGAKRDEILSILWNTYSYYSQFSAQVSAHIKEKRAPIEKKLRDFVKICSWDRDLSYWSVKDTVDKAHKALHKHTKEFENVLKESVRSFLVDNSSDSGADHVGIWDRPKRATGAAVPAGGAYMIDTQNFLVLARNVKKYIDQAEKPSDVIPEGSLLSKTPSLLNKARTLCKDTMAYTDYPSLVQGLDDFVTTVIETSTHLGSLEVDSTLPKEKQVSQAKNIIQQKRKALADLFKYLTKMGLNYRTGLVILASAEGELFDFTIPPFDLDVMLTYLKSRRCDGSLSLLWSGCNTYYQKNIARHRQLSAALQSPHQDLGLPNIERCKGFAAQLVNMSNTQKESLSEHSRCLYQLRTLATDLTNALEVDIAAIKTVNLYTFAEKVEDLTECYVHCSLVLDQFSVLLKSCPEQSVSESEYDSAITDSPIVRCFKNSDEWNDLYKRIKSIITTVSKQKAALLKLQPNDVKIGEHEAPDELRIICQSHLDITKEARNNIDIIAAEVNALLEHHRFTLKNPSVFDVEQIDHPVLQSMRDMANYLKAAAKAVDDRHSSTEFRKPDIHVDELLSKTEDVIETMLLDIQGLYKKYLPKNVSAELVEANDAIVDGDLEKNEVKELLEDKHLKEFLQDRLTDDLAKCQLEDLIVKLYELLNSYLQYIAGSNADEKGRDVVMRLVPIMEQTVLFGQYFFTQQVAVHRVTCKMLSVLLKIFSDLATKGFCKPSDLDTEEGEGEGGPGKLSGGMGLGDGEGQKDVSDRIENQDQLDDAHRPGEEEKQKDKDCKEEEQGVNMTDDFDSHLQDVEEGDDEEKEEDDKDDDDADKQMGDTDNAAEKLDQQIWGSDEEEEEEENQENKKEEKGQGESTGEKEMGAKEDEKGADDGSEGKEKKQKKDINDQDQEIDDDQVDPYHGKQPQMPEPEDFDLPDNMNMDGEEEDDKEGETETENPFEIDVTKDDMPKEQEELEEDDKGEDGKDTKHGTEVSSDEEDGENDENKEQKDKEEETPQADDAEMETETQDDDDKGDIDDNADGQNPQETEQPEENPENSEKEDLPKNPEKPDEDEEVEQKNQEANPQAVPSNNDPSAEDRAENAQMDTGTDDNVDTNAAQKKDEESAPFEQAQEQVGEDKQSMGRSELDQSDRGHRGEKQAASRDERSQLKRKQQENKPGQTDQERTLGDVTEKKLKQSHTLNVEREEEADDGGAGEEDQDKDADAFQHVKQAKKDDLQAIDAATKEQAEQQPTLQQEEDEEAEKLKEDEDVAMDVDDNDLTVEKSEELKSEKVASGKDKEKEKSGNKKEGDDEVTGEAGVEVDGEAVPTQHVPRGKDTTFHTRLDDQKPDRIDDITTAEYMSIRSWLQGGAATSHGAVGVWRALWQSSAVPARALCERLRLVLEPTGRSRKAGAATSHGAVGVWRALWQSSAVPARALCERLRLVLEPTGRSRKAGDFRTGRAINMRRVIPYIASHFRKDRIWLRRTKPSKREYKICIAVDDSSSMSDNRSKQLAFESLALVSQALNLLESGDLAVLSFGEHPNLLHPFTEQFSEHSGSKILEQLRFEQTKTKIAQLLDFVTVMFEEQTVRSDAVNAKLLVVVSDGRGIFSEGETRVVQAVRRARQMGIFLVYVIIDNPDNKDSIMDIRRPIIDPSTNTLTGFVSYLETFPFPFYLVLRDMDALPTVLGDALRQWFELAANAAN